MDVNLRLGAVCNQRCLFCNVTVCDELSTVEAMRIAKQKYSGKTVLSITGGEPMLRKDLLEIISEARRNPTIEHIALQTNATLASYAEYAQKLKEAGLDMVTVSFHSHNEELSNRLTDSQLWSKTVDGIKNLIAAGVAVTLNIVINKLNYQILPEYVRFARREFPGLKNICFSFVQPYGRAWENKWIVPRYDEVLAAVSEATSLCEEYGLDYVNPYCGFPLCLFPSAERSDEYADSRAREPMGDKEQDSLGKVAVMKVKSEECGVCGYNDCCNGVWANYAKIHGTKELRAKK